MLWFNFRMIELLKNTLSVDEFARKFIVDSGAGTVPLIDSPNAMDCRHLLRSVVSGSAAAVFFDPQYRGILDFLHYGNEGERQVERSKLPQMDGEVISECLKLISVALRPSGHLFYWTDKFELLEGLSKRHSDLALDCVELITWQAPDRYGAPGEISFGIFNGFSESAAPGQGCVVRSFYF
jgi:hypothetical protein